jgi:hypothetical protein
LTREWGRLPDLRVVLRSVPLGESLLLMYYQWVADKLLFLLSEEAVAVPPDRASELVLALRPTPGALRARAKIERALSSRASAVAFDSQEKAALLDGLNISLDTHGFESLGADLASLRGALEYELGVMEDAAS